MVQSGLNWGYVLLKGRLLVTRAEAAVRLIAVKITALSSLTRRKPLPFSSGILYTVQPFYNFYNLGFHFAKETYCTTFSVILSSTLLNEYYMPSLLEDPSYQEALSQQCVCEYQRTSR